MYFYIIQKKSKKCYILTNFINTKILIKKSLFFPRRFSFYVYQFIFCVSNSEQDYGDRSAQHFICNSFGGFI